MASLVRTCAFLTAVVICYPMKSTRSGSSHHEERPERRRLTISYYPGFSDRVKRRLKRAGLQVIMEPSPRSFSVSNSNLFVTTNVAFKWGLCVVAIGLHYTVMASGRIHNLNEINTHFLRRNFETKDSHRHGFRSI